MSENSRLRNITFLIDSAFHLQGENLEPSQFEDMSDEEIAEEVEWFDYLWNK